MIKSSLLRLKSIASANLNYFVWASLVSAIGFIAIAACIELFFSNIKSFQFSPAWQVIITCSFFALPLLEYVVFHTNKRMSGLEEIKLNLRITKRNLFMAAGCGWSSLAAVALTILTGGREYLTFFATLSVLVSLHIVYKLLIKYVFTLQK